jgi:SAM-dependent methyltransferase
MTATPEQYWEQRLRRRFDLQGVGYAGLGKRYNSWLYRVRGHVFRRILLRLLIDVDSASILDVGSGTGFYVEQWRKLGVRSLVGVDLTAISVERLRSMFPQYRFWQADIGSTNDCLADQSFQIISAFDVFFHIVDDDEYESAIRNVHALLKPGGLLIFSENFLHAERKESAYQVNRCIDDIVRCVTGAGFEIIARYPMFYIMNAPVDSDNKALHLFWRMTSALISRSELAGAVVGALLFPLELLLVRWADEGPTTEIMVCKRGFSDARE